MKIVFNKFFILQLHLRNCFNSSHPVCQKHEDYFLKNKPEVLKEAIVQELNKDDTHYRD